MKKKYSKGMCPVCNELLSRFEVFGVELDQCPKCKGLWFDADELETVKDAMAEDLRWKHFDLRAYADKAHFKHTKMRCPACGSALCELRFDTSRIELEFCAKCNGVWMGKGKLIPILNHLRKKASLEPIEQIEKETLHEFFEIFVGRKGPLNELKDFAAAWRMLTLKFMVEHPDLAQRLNTARSALPF